MSHRDDCPKRRSQFLTRGSLFKNHAAKVYVFDRIRHGTALEILSRASAACRFESPHTAVSEHQWREYFGLAPAALDKTLDIHKALQGVSLTAAIACAVTAGNIARLQAEQNEIEEIKTRAITADVVDEIATSDYISQQQRQQEAEQILNPREHLERSLALTYDGEGESEPHAQTQLAKAEQNDLENGELERAERIMQLKAKGWGKAKIILEVWGVSKGGSPKYKAAEAEYKRLVEGGG